MSSSLHLDLLKDEERYSSNPIRLRVMIPMTALFAAFSVALWWGLYAIRIHNQIQMKGELEQEISELKPAHNALLALQAQERDFAAEARQIRFYQNSRVQFGETISKLGLIVPAKMQFTEMRVLPPPPSPVDPLTLGPTNTAEVVTMRIAGRISGERPSEAVDALFSALRTPTFTNLIRTAEIPKGAFRQDLAKDPSNRETLLFELICGCAPRRFE